MAERTRGSTNTTSSGGAFIAVPLNIQHTTTTNITSTSFVSVANTTQVSVDIPEAGEYLVTLDTVADGAGGNFTATYRVVIDLGEAGEQILGDNDVWKRYFLDSNHHSARFSALVNLTAGSHTFDAQVKVPAGKTLRHNENMRTALTIIGYNK